MQKECNNKRIAYAHKGSAVFAEDATKVESLAKLPCVSKLMTCVTYDGMTVVEERRAPVFGEVLLPSNQRSIAALS